MKKKFLFAAFLICGAISSVAEEKPRYKDASLPVEERVEDLLRRMTLHEKVLQLQNNSTSDINAIENTYKGGSPGSVHEMSKSAKEAALLFNKMQEYLLTQNRLGIPALVTVEGINGVTQNGCTIFPQAIAQGSTFNPELVEEMSRAIGRESHVIGIRQLQCPVLDIARDLRWGRVEETFGEDPFLIGEMGTAFVRGSQAEGVGAMPKHFVAHGTPTGGLNCASVPGGERELRNLYAYPFAKVIQNADPVSIMGCYSAYDGIPVAHSAHFMTDLLRGELGFKGFVYSDWGSVDRLKSFHFAAETSEEAARKALIAGIDMDVYDWAYQTLEDQVNKGILDEAYVDRACRRVLAAKFRLGVFDDPYGDPDKVDKVVRSKAHVALAKKVADESIVLLENKNDILPLDLKKYKSIAVLGPNSNYGVAGDYGWVEFDNRECVTLFDGLKQAVGKDVQVNQLDDLLKAVKATGKPVVVVLISGKPLVMTWAKEHADAVVLQFYGGEQQGNAMADVLLGKVNPSGRLNVSFPRSTGNTPCYYNYYPSDREQVFDQGGSYEEPNGHYIFEKPYALWNFGRGLSYTDFEYTDVHLSDTVFSGQGKLSVTLKVKNTGRRDGKEVVQLYVRDKFSSVVMPIQQLKAFKKVEVPAGGEVEVRLEMPIDELAFYNETLHRLVEPGEFEIQVGHASDDIVFRKTIVVK